MRQPDRESAARPPRLRQRQGQHAAVAGTAPNRFQPAQRTEQLHVVVLVRGGFAGVALGPDAGSATQRVHLDARVVSKRREARQSGVETGLLRRVGLECLAVLDGLVWDPEIVEVDQRGSQTQQFAQFAQLVGGSSGDEKARSIGRPIGRRAQGPPSHRCCYP